KICPILERAIDFCSKITDFVCAGRWRFGMNLERTFFVVSWREHGRPSAALDKKQIPRLRRTIRFTNRSTWFGMRNLVRCSGLGFQIVEGEPVCFGVLMRHPASAHYSSA